MRILAASLVLAACATAPAPPPGARLEGCWLNRQAGQSMSWLPDPARAGVLNGLRSGGGSFVLRPSDQGWRFCELSPAGERCWSVAEGGGGSLEGGRVFVDGHGDRLRIELVGDGPSQVIFQGRRTRCE